MGRIGWEGVARVGGVADCVHACLAADTAGAVVQSSWISTSRHEATAASTEHKAISDSKMASVRQVETVRAQRGSQPTRTV